MPEIALSGNVFSETHFRAEIGRIWGAQVCREFLPHGREFSRNPIKHVLRASTALGEVLPWAARRAEISLLRGFPQFSPEDLANVGLRQLGTELDVAGLFVAGELLAAELLDGLGSQVGVFSDDDDFHRFA